MTRHGDEAQTADDLFDETVSLAMAHVLALRDHLGAAADQASPELGACLDDCREDVHRLLVDIVSVRNAAELLRRSHELRSLPGRPLKGPGRRYPPSA